MSTREDRGQELERLRRRVDELEARLAGRDDDVARRLETMLEHSLDVICEADAEGQLLYVSPNVREVLGVEPEAFMGRVALDSLHPEDVPGVRQAFEQAKFEPTSIVARYPRADQSFGWLESVGRAYRNAEGELRMVSVTRNVTERMEREEALRRSEANQRALLEAIPDLIFRNRRDGTIVDFVPSKEVTPLMEPEEFLGKLVRDVLPPPVAEVIGEASERAFRLGQTATAEYRLPGPDGRMLDFECRIAVAGEDESVALVREVTQARRSEAAQRRAQRLEALARLAGGIAHEINNPVGSMLVAAQHALTLHEEGSAPAAASDLRRIVDEAKRCGRIVRSVLELGREQEIEVWPGDLNEVVRRTRDRIIDEVAAAPGSRIRVETEDDLPPAMLNPGEMERALVNLTRNALEAAEGAVEIVLETSRSPGGVRLCVVDDGPGMNPDVKERAFDPFFTTRGMHGGIGLGLSLVYGIVRAHGGTIEVESEVGAGTRMIIELPPAPEA